MAHRFGNEEQQKVPAILFRYDPPPRYIQTGRDRELYKISFQVSSHARSGRRRRWPRQAPICVRRLNGEQETRKGGKKTYDVSQVFLT